MGILKKGEGGRQREKAINSGKLKHPNKEPARTSTTGTSSDLFIITLLSVLLGILKQSIRNSCTTFYITEKATFAIIKKSGMKIEVLSLIKTKVKVCKPNY